METQATKLLTVNQCSEILNLKPSTIRKMIYQARIPKVKIGRAVRIRQEDIEKITQNGLK